MPIIKILPDTLISQIAAGEVVERPASVVKELIENSVDSGANFIGIEIEQGGMKSICVRDNGCGMDREDAVMAFARHATSKIATLEDLEKINSYGFRGEALAAIASVAMVSLKTRNHSANEGVEVTINGGEKPKIGTAGFAPGTEITVKNLFFNTPARRKFIKSEQTEFGHIAAVVSHAALANPTIAIELKNNAKTVLSARKANSLGERLSVVLGANFLKELVPVSFKTMSIDINGFVGRPGMTLGSKRHQYLFVNGRDIGDPLVSRAVADAYGTRIPGREYPVYLLNINIDPTEVDINVHPRKMAVKWSDTQRIYRDVKQAVNQSLNAIETGEIPTQNLSIPNQFSNKTPENSVQSALEFSSELLSQEKRQAGLEIEENRPRVLGQIANSYILTFDEEGIFIVDQHAAHERILYEKFKSRHESTETVSQPLLVPLAIDCTAEEKGFMTDAIKFLSEIGFEFEEWSGNTFILQSCPTALKSQNLAKILRDFLDDMIAEKTPTSILPEKILKSLACKAAVKFGMPLSQNEQAELLIELAKTPNNSTCPHGRPVKIALTFSELEKRFYRRK